MSWQRKHGLSRHPLFRRWKNMRQRCLNPNNNAYPRYGGRGIKVCDQWVNDFKAFHDWSLGNGYDENLELDRMDNNGDYSPDNCRFTTTVENCNNQRRNVKYQFNGELLSLPQISRLTGVKRTTILARIKLQGLSINEAVAK